MNKKIPLKEVAQDLSSLKQSRSQPLEIPRPSLDFIRGFILGHDVQKSTVSEQASVKIDEDMQDLKRLAGMDAGSNISVTGDEKRQIQDELGIKPGTPEWFRLWFSRPFLTGEQPK